MDGAQRPDSASPPRTVEFVSELTLDAITSTARAADAVLAEAGADADARYFCHLAIEEMLTNIARHSPHGPRSANVRLTVEAEDFTLVFTDAGAPFDSTSAPEPDLSLPVAARPVGGLGLFLLRQLAASFTSERVGACNVNTLRHALRERNG